MNATFDTSLDGAAPDGRVATRPVHRTHRFRLLLLREFWEHKGGFFWAPIIAGAVFLLVTLMGIGVGEVAMHRSASNLNIDGRQVSIQGIDLGRITSHMSPEDMRRFGEGINGALYISALWALVVFGVVVFFYCLGALYDERKDRSVLFWKSMPISDAETVLSKVAMALVVGPLIAVAAGVATMLGLLLLLGIMATMHGANPMTLVWGPADPLDVIANLVGSLPVYALWALPTVGWLLLCSSWARSKPFLWALLVPVGAGLLLGWFNLMGALNIDNAWYWRNIAGRVLGSAWPGSSLAYAAEHQLIPRDHDPLASMHAFNGLAANWQLMATPSMWLGIVAGIAMIYAAIRMRRYRDEG